MKNAWFAIVTYFVGMIVGGVLVRSIYRMQAVSHPPQAHQEKVGTPAVQQKTEVPQAPVPDPAILGVALSNQRKNKNLQDEIARMKQETGIGCYVVIDTKCARTLRLVTSDSALKGAALKLKARGINVTIWFYGTNTVSNDGSAVYLNEDATLASLRRFILGT